MLDTIASRVNGPIKAKDCRVVWKDGWIYVAKEPGDIVAMECEEPIKRSGYWRTTIGAQFLTFNYPGCGSCRARILASPVGQMSADAIIAAVEAVDAQ